MAITIFNPNVIGKQTLLTGEVGPNAHTFLPGYGYFFSSGQIYDFPNAEIPQKTYRVMNGLTKPNTFRKDASSCPIAV